MESKTKMTAMVDEDQGVIYLSNGSFCTIESLSTLLNANDAICYYFKSVDYKSKEVSFRRISTTDVGGHARAVISLVDARIERHHNDTFQRFIDRCFAKDLLTDEDREEKI